MNRDPAPAALTFQWPEPHAIPWTLAGCIGLSLLAHALSFYIFQITYPPSAHVTPPPAQVSILSADSPENDALLRWLDAEDPALAAKPPHAAPPEDLTVRYTPSFAEVRALPKTWPEPEPAFSYPAAESGYALIARAAPRPAEATAPSQPAPATQLRLSGALAARLILHRGAWDFSPSALTELQPVRFLLGVSGRGEVRYVFLRESSGDKALDAQAEAQLRRADFSAAPDAPLAWGFAAFSWGAEVFAPAEVSHPNAAP